MEDQIIAYLAKYELADEFLVYAKEAILRLSSSVHAENQEKRKSYDLRLNQIDLQLEKLNKAVLDGYFTTEEGIGRKNELIEQRHILRQELGEVEDLTENGVWNLTEQVLQIFNYLPYKYKELNPIVKRKLLNLLFLNRQLKGQKLLIEAIPALEKLKGVNYLIQGQKTMLNRLQKGEKPHELGFPQLGMELQTSNCTNGGPGWD